MDDLNKIDLNPRQFYRSADNEASVHLTRAGSIRLNVDSANEHDLMLQQFSAAQAIPYLMKKIYILRHGARAFASRHPARSSSTSTSEGSHEFDESDPVDDVNYNAEYFLMEDNVLFLPTLRQLQLALELSGIAELQEGPLSNIVEDSSSQPTAETIHRALLGLFPTSQPTENNVIEVVENDAKIEVAVPGAPFSLPHSENRRSVRVSSSTSTNQFTSTTTTSTTTTKTFQQEDDLERRKMEWQKLPWWKRLDSDDDLEDLPKEFVAKRKRLLKDRASRSQKIEKAYEKKRMKWESNRKSRGGDDNDDDEEEVEVEIEEVKKPILSTSVARVRSSGLRSRRLPTQLSPAQQPRQIQTPQQPQNQKMSPPEPAKHQHSQTTLTPRQKAVMERIYGKKVVSKLGIAPSPADDDFGKENGKKEGENNVGGEFQTASDIHRRNRIMGRSGSGSGSASQPSLGKREELRREVEEHAVADDEELKKMRARYPSAAGGKGRSFSVRGAIEKGMSGGATTTTTTTTSGIEIPPELESYDQSLVERVLNDVLSKPTPLTWDDIAGLSFAKRTLQEMLVWPLQRPDLFHGIRGPPRGLLLFGPPGNGKTLIGKVVASSANCTFLNISASSITSKWVGQGEAAVRVLFAVARVYQPSIIFIDEIDSLLCQRSESDFEASRRIKTEFLVQLDGAATSENDRVFVIGATNRPFDLDEAARRRLVKRLYIPLPSSEARKSLFNRLIETQKISISDDEWEKIFSRSEGYSGADIRALVAEASYGPIRGVEDILNLQDSDVRPIEYQDFDSAFRAVRASVSNSDLDLFLDWNRKFGSFQNANSG